MVLVGHMGDKRDRNLAPSRDHKYRDNNMAKGGHMPLNVPVPYLLRPCYYAGWGYPYAGEDDDTWTEMRVL